MGRGNSAHTGKPEYLYQCPNNFFDAAALHKDGERSKEIRADVGDSKVAELGKELSELSVARGDLENEDGAEDLKANRSSESANDVGSRLTCNRCKCTFQSSDEQRSHFKSDWHRMNVKLRLVGKEPMSEDDFTKVAEGQWKGDNDDVSSISGSDSESDDPDTADTGGLRRMTRKSNRIHFVLEDSGHSISLWRSVVLAEREYFPSEKGVADEESSDVHCVSEVKLLQRLKSLIPPELTENVASARHVWVVLLSGGGHFAGVVMNMQGGGVLAHHTFHRYVVRAKAGGRQSTRDATGRAPKSAGASLRRYNEMALQKEIRDLLTSWADYLRSASHIFVYAPSANGQALFGGENAPLNRTDPRMRRIPFTTRRPTLKEAQRVYRVLATITYDEDEPSSSYVTVETPAIITDGKTGGKGESKRSGKKPAAGKDSADSGGPSTSENPADIPCSSGAEAPTPTGTPLHEAVKAGNKEQVLRLLEDGLDPCVRDERGKTPYALAGDKETRNVFRRYMARFPDQWDWHAADVPSALTEEMEMAQAAKEAEKKAKRKVLEKERKKLRKEQDKKKEAEKKAAELAAAAVANVRGTSDVKSFSKAPAPDTKSAAYQAAVAKAHAAEREARAAAAEARMRALMAAKESQPAQTSSSSSGSSSYGSKLCSCCGDSLAGKTPFYKFSYSYCSTTCVQVHRKYLESEGQ